MIADISCKPNQFKFGREWSFLVLLFTFTTLQLKSQVSPLKISDEGTYLISKNKTPFLLNASSIELYSDVEELSRSLSRFRYQGVNTAFVSLRSDDIIFNSKGSPERILKRKITALKRLVREARYQGTAVMISPFDSVIPLNEDVKALYLTLLFRKFNNFNNVIWLLNANEFKKDIINVINTKQLKGVNCGVTCHVDSTFNVDFRVIDNINLLDTSFRKPSLLRIHPGKDKNDSTAHAVRSQAYTAILNGASGVIVDYSQYELQANQHNTYNPVSFHLRQYKAVFDTLPWYKFVACPEIIHTSEGILNVLVPSVISRDSSMVAVYLSSALTLPLNLSTFKSGVKISWINAATGRVLYSKANSTPVHQLFLLPASEEKNKDWLVILQHNTASKQE